LCLQGVFCELYKDCSRGNLRKTTWSVANDVAAAAAAAAAAPVFVGGSFFTSWSVFFAAATAVESSSWPFVAASLVC
jgi:hypothetical protein